MTRIYSTQFFCGILPAAPTDIWDVAAGTVVVVRDIEVFNSGLIAYAFNVQAYVSGSSGWIFGSTSLAASASSSWRGRAVIPAGGELRVYGGGVSAFYATISGYVLGA